MAEDEIQGIVIAGEVIGIRGRRLLVTAAHCPNLLVPRLTETVEKRNALFFSEDEVKFFVAKKLLHSDH